MIDVRDVAGDEDAETYLRLRNEIHPRDPVSAAAFAEMRARPRRLDVIAFLEGEPVGVGTYGDHFVDPEGPLAFANVRVRRDRRRRGIGSSVLARLAAEAVGHGRSGFYTVVPGDDADSLAFFDHRGWERVLEMQDVELALVRAAPGEDSSHAPAVEVPSDDSSRGLRLVPLAEELDHAVYEAALEVEQDLQTAAPMAALEFERWRQRQFRPLVRRDLSFAVLDGPLVAGYAILEETSPGLGDHAITGVRRAYRGRGLAGVLKQAQIRSATAAGLRRLRASNTVSNLPMRALNERLGYRQTHLSVHLQGPLP